MTDSGVCIWLTGPSGAGKTTMTDVLVPMLEAAGRTVSVFDVVPLLAKLPGESTSEGKLLRKAFVAGEVAKHGGVAICVTVSASADVRLRAREIVGDDRFVEVRLEVPVDVAEARRRDRGSTRSPVKRLRRVARAAAGRLDERDPAPSRAEVRIDTTTTDPAGAAAAVLAHLRARGFVS